MGYDKFVKDLVMKKRTVSFELVDNLYYWSAIVTRSPVQKTSDLGAFPIHCTIGAFCFAKEVCDLRSSINLMSLAIYQ